MRVQDVSLDLKSEDGRTVGKLRIVAPPHDGQIPLLEILTPDEARQWHEQPIQLLEGTSYDYEMRSLLPHVRMRQGVIRKGRLSEDLVERGRVEPGLNTGVLTFVLEDYFGKQKATASVEVRSSKLGYRQDYRSMLNDIADKSINLLLEIKSPSANWLKPGMSDDVPSIVQRFFFIRHLINSTEFRGAIGQIISNPHEATVTTSVERPVGRGLKIAGNLTRWLSAGQPRQPLPPSHRLHDVLRSIPYSLPSLQRTPTRCNDENRFVKSLLEAFVEYLSALEIAMVNANTNAFATLAAECKDLRDQLTSIIYTPFFRDVTGKLPRIPLQSTVLQRRAGYREMLRVWIQFNVVAELNWDGASDLFLAGKRDVASLYEYWVFFQILEVFKRKCTMAPESSDVLLQPTAVGGTLKLKSGRSLSLEGRWAREDVHLRMKFSYNRVFSRKPEPAEDLERSFPNSGSWTKTMRPDYTITMWPEELKEQEAEVSGRIIHLHFDAKYRIDNLIALFGQDDEDEYEESRQGVTVKRQDLLKMHAYRDAIRRSGSAFVLYPGSENQRWRAFTDLLPGLGALALVPGRTEGVDALSAFLEEAAEVVASKFAPS